MELKTILNFNFEIYTLHSRLRTRNRWEQVNLHFAIVFRYQSG